MDRVSQLVQAIGIFLIGISLTGGLIYGVSTIRNGLHSNTITVTGKATRSVSPDQSVISGTWEEEAKTSNEAREKVKELAGKGLEAIKGKDIDEKKITTTRVSVYPEYDYSIQPTSSKSKLIGYRASTSLQVTLDDAKRADEIISVMTENKATRTEGPTLGLTTKAKEELAKQLKEEAIVDAKQVATGMAKQAGARLGKVVSISGGHLNEGPGPVPVDSRALSFDVSSSSAESVPSDIAIGEEEISATVNVVYRLK